MRTTETASRDDFFAACPDHLVDQMHDELTAWEGGESCATVEYSTDGLGRIDSESSPRPTRSQVVC